MTAIVLALLAIAAFVGASNEALRRQGEKPRMYLDDIIGVVCFSGALIALAIG